MYSLSCIHSIQLPLELERVLMMQLPQLYFNCLIPLKIVYVGFCHSCQCSFLLVCLSDSVVSGGEHVDVIIGAAVADGKVTPKVQSLIKILLKYQHTDDFRAIVFVERVVAALVLPKVN